MIMTTTEQNAVGTLLDNATPSVSKSKETSPVAPSISGESTTLEATTANHSPLTNVAEEQNSATSTATSVLPLVAINSDKKNSLEKIPLSSPTMTATRTAAEPPKKDKKKK